MLRPDRLPVTVAEVAFLTQGSWAALAQGSTVGIYCHNCDDTDALLVVQDFYLSREAHGVVAEGVCQRCGEPSACVFGVLDRKRWQQVLSGRQ